MLTSEYSVGDDGHSLEDHQRSQQAWSVEEKQEVTLFEQKRTATFAREEDACGYEQEENKLQRLVKIKQEGGAFQYTSTSASKTS